MSVRLSYQLLNSFKMEQLKQIVFWTTGIILGLIILGSFTLAFKLTSMKFPAPPTLITSSNPAEQEAKTKEIANYKELTVAMQTQQTNIFNFCHFKNTISYIIINCNSSINIYFLRKQH